MEPLARADRAIGLVLLAGSPCRHREFLLLRRCRQDGEKAPHPPRLQRFQRRANGVYQEGPTLREV